MLTTKSRFFITGTDTNIGKTQISLGLLEYFNARDFKTIGLKPIASGCNLTEEGLRNEDALLLQKHASEKLPYTEINAFSFAEPIAPHIAALKASQPLSVQATLQACQAGLYRTADVHLIEGVGGWLVPLNEQESCADLAIALELPVILVVGMRLGCINHALLTASHIVNSGLSFAGWVANMIDPEILYPTENIASLQQRIPAPLLGIVPFQTTPDPKVTASHLNLK